MLVHEYSWHDVVFLAESSDGCRAAKQQRGGFTGKTLKGGDVCLKDDGERDEKAEAETLECTFYSSGKLNKHKHLYFYTPSTAQQSQYLPLPPFRVVWGEWGVCVC